MVALVDSVMATWAPDTRHYVTDDGQHLAVHVADGLDAVTTELINESLEVSGIPTLESGIHTLVVEPTTIIECTEEGIAVNLTPLHTFPPGTSHEDALAQAGYQ